MDIKPTTACTETRVFIVEDSASVRDRLRQQLGGMHGVEVIGDADSPSSAIDGILRTRPDSVVLDLHLSGGSGIEVLRNVHALVPDVMFIVLTNQVNAQYRRICMAAGASYFFDKSSEFENVGKVVGKHRPAQRQTCSLK